MPDHRRVGCPGPLAQGPGRQLVTTDRPGSVADDAGATSVEYALMAALITAVIVGSVTLLGQEVIALFLIPCGALGPC